MHLKMNNRHPAFFILIILFSFQLQAQSVTIPIETSDHVIVLQTDKNNLLRTVYFGRRLQSPAEYATSSKVNRLDDENAGIYNAAYTSAGTWNLAEPAIQVKHPDGNTSLELKYSTYSQEQIDGNTSLTKIVLKDNVYPFQVTLFYKSWKKENVIEQWTEIQHGEKKSVLMQKYASANLYFPDRDFYLRTFHN